MVENTWTFPRYAAIQEKWADEGPPVASWAAAYFKFKPAKRRKKKDGPKRAAQAAQELLALFR